MTINTLPLAGEFYPVSDNSPPRRFPQSKTWAGSYGRLMQKWGGALSNSQGSVQFSGDLPPYPDVATRSVEIQQSAAGSFAQATTETSDYTPSGTTTVTAGVWAKNTGGRTLNFQITFFNIAGSTQIRWNGAVDPGDWVFLTFSPSQFNLNNFVYGTDLVRNIRIAQHDAGSEGAWQPGEKLLFSNVYMDIRARPRFLIGNDDGSLSVSSPIATITGMPASGRSFADIVEYYGFRGSLFISPGFVGTSGYMTWSQIRAMADRGWTICAHSYSHPADLSGRGLTLLGPIGVSLGWAGNPTYYSRARNDDTAIYDDCYRGLEALKYNGFRSPEKMFALPQGAWDGYVRTAVKRLGVGWVRAISLTTPTNAHTLSFGQPSGGGVAGSAASLVPGGWMGQVDSVQTDGATTLQQVYTYIDECIAQGATGTNYHHQLDATNAVILDGMCAYLRAKADAGLIDVMTGEEFAYEEGL